MERSHCKECHEELSATAESCPKCGAETPLKIYRRKALNNRLQWAGVSVFGLIMMMGFAVMGLTMAATLCRGVFMLGMFGAIFAWGSGKKPDELKGNQD